MNFCIQNKQWHMPPLMEDENTVWYDDLINKVLQENDNPELATQLWQVPEAETETSSDESAT